MTVEELLREKGLLFTSSGRDYLIKCLNPDHEDSSPSLRIDKISGVAHCFACGWRRNLFKHYGAIPPVNSIKLSKLKDKIKELKLTFLDLQMPDDVIPYTQAFRGISVSTLKKFEAFYTFSVEKLADRIVFPIRDITGKITSFNARHTLSDANPRYIFYPEHSVVGCYPVILENQYSSIVIVEGIMDMLNMYDKGVHNAVCVFGTHSLKNNIQQKLLPYKTQGIRKIFILFDGDAAGSKAAIELKPLIEEQDFIVEIIDLPEGVDPGDLDAASVMQIKEYIK